MKYKKKILASGEVVNEPQWDFHLKVKVRKSGNIIYVDERPNGGYYGNDGLAYTEEELDFDNLESSQIDWEQRRYEIASRMAAAITSNPTTMNAVLSMRGTVDEIVADLAVESADTLIKKLKKHS